MNTNSESSETALRMGNGEKIGTFDQQIQNYLANTPIAFTENRGQLENDEVLFYDQGGSVWFTDDGMWMELREEIKSQESRVKSLESPDSGLTTNDWRLTTNEYKRVILKQEFMGADTVIPEGRDRLSWDSNFFYGNDPSKWCTSVPNYGEIYYENIYNGIDLRYYTFEDQLKYDLIVHPGGDVNQIRVRYNGAENLELSKLGNLKINTRIKSITDGELYIYQDIDGKRERVSGEFNINNDNEYGFRISDNYDPRKNLVIDPIIKYSTFVGGSGADSGWDITRDSNNKVYVVGYTGSEDFPTTPYPVDYSYNGLGDLIIFKMDPTCSNLLYSTYVGGSGTEEGYAIDVDLDGNAHVCGYTRSLNFPLTFEAFDPINNDTDYYDSFVLKINSMGNSLLYSTMIEGDDYDLAHDLVVDSSGNAIITGVTQSDNFPLKNSFDSSFDGEADLFVVKLNSLGSDLIFSTYIGGSGGEHGYRITTDFKDNLYITGVSASSDFPISNNAFKKTFTGNADIFVLKFSNQGDSILFSTFIGSNWDYDQPVDIKADNEGYSYITGYTRSPDFPVTPNAYKPPNSGARDLFITKFNTDGSDLIFSSLIGGTGDEMPRSLEVDSNNNVFVVGDTGSSDFPVTQDAIYEPKSKYSNGFLIKLSNDGSELKHSTFIGGSGQDGTLSIVLDSDDEVYVMGNTNSTDFPTTPDAYDTSLDNNYKIYIMKILLKPFINITSTTFDENKITMTAYSQGGIYNYKLKVFNTGSSNNLQNVKLTFDPTGSGVVLGFDRSKDDFHEVSDRNDYISIHSSSKAIFINNYWQLDFNVTFNWTYPDEKYHSVKASGTANTYSPFSTTSPLIYHVENDLIFQGSLTVKDKSNATIKENSLIRGGQDLTFSGLTSVYEGTNNKFPTNGSFGVSVWDENGVSWITSLEPGEPCNLEISAPTKTYSKGHTFTINHSGIPTACDKTSQTFKLKIDSDNVTFGNSEPENSIWQLKPEVIAKIDISDNGGGEVHASSIMRSFSTDNGSTWSPWIKANLIENNPDKSVTVTSNVELAEGKYNLIKWRAKDSLDNGPSESDEYRIIVDSEPVIFTNVYPSDTDIALSETVEIGITISDNTSGVRASTIKYSISTDSGETWSKWYSLENFKSGSVVNAKLNLTFSTGSSNRIRFQANDIAGQTSQSPEYVINVKTWDSLSYPAVNLISPLNGSTLYNNHLTLQWKLLTPQFTDITYEIYFGKTNPPKLHKIDVSDTSIMLDNLDFNKTYYWKVIPNVDDLSGICVSGVWSFKIDFPLYPDWDFSSKIKIEGPDLISINRGEMKNIDLTLFNFGSRPDKITVSVSESNLINHITLDTSLIMTQDINSIDQFSLSINIPKDFAVGKYDVPIIARSDNNGGKIVARHTITVEVLKKDSESSSFFDDGGATNLVIIAIIIIILIVIVLLLIRKSRKTRSLKGEKTDPNITPSNEGAESQPVEPFGNLPNEQSNIIWYDQQKKNL